MSHCTYGMISGITYNETLEGLDLMIINDLPVEPFRLIGTTMSGTIRVI
jgi:hypothetical protein